MARRQKRGRLLAVDYLPIFLDLRGRLCLVVGGGAIAAQRAAVLQRAGARLRVVSPKVGAELGALLVDTGDLRRRAYAAEDLEGVALVMAATDDAAVNRGVHGDATARGIPVNVCDEPPLCSFIMPSIVDRSPLVAAMSTGGASPALARLMREKIEQALPDGYRRLAQLASSHREVVKTRIPDLAARGRFWDKVVRGEVAALMLDDRDGEAEAALVALLEKQDP